MKLVSPVKEQCFCAFCKSSRTIYAKKHVGWIDIALVMLFSATLASGLWTWFDPRGLVICGLGVGLAEAFIYLRWRFGLVCQYCGFDPILYRRSSALASAKVRAFYEEKIKDPTFLLSKSPLLEVYRKSNQARRQTESVHNALVPEKSQPGALQ